MLESQDMQEIVCALPFVRQAEGGNLAFWDTEASGHEDTDIERGENYARLAIEIARVFDAPVLVAMILRDMTLAGQFTGVEAGFISIVASAARAGKLN